MMGVTSYSQKDFALRLIRILIIISLFVSAGCRQKPSQDVSGETVLQHRLRSNIQTLDPANVGDVPSHAVAAEIFECLYAYHYLKRPYELVPALAEGMPEVSDGGMIYTIKVKKGVYFSDDECFPGGKGRELVAGDFVYEWKRIANVKTLSQNWWVFDNRIVGLDEFRDYTKECSKSGTPIDYSREVEGLKALDDHTLFIKLKKPWPQIMHILAFLPTAPVAREAVEHYGLNIRGKPVGTGAFKMKVWNRGSYIEMVRNENYREVFYPSEGAPGDAEAGLLVDAGKRVPFVDRILWRIVTEDQPRWLIFLKGDTDIMSIPKDNYGQAIAFGMEMTEDMRARNIQLSTFREPDTFYVGMNMIDPVLGENKPLRLAINCAIDRERWIDIFYNGRGDVAYGFIPPELPDYDPNIVKVSRTEYNPEKGKRLVEEAKKVHGGELPTLLLTMSGTDTTYRQMGQFLETSFENIGLDIEPEYLDWPTYLTKLRKKTMQLFSAGWIMDYPDVENFLQVFYSKNAPWPNSTNYSNPEYDSIYEQASLMVDSPERTELYRKAERVLVEDSPCAFTYHRVFFVMRHEWVSNFKPDAYKPDSFGFGLSKYYRIDSAKRAEYKSENK